MANVTYSAGIATAYGAAVRGGYTGTYDDFCRQQAEYAESAAAVEQAKEDAEAAASAADTSKTAAAGSASAAATSAGQASTSATNAANSATEANASKNAAATSATEAGNSATAAAGSASDAQTSADDAQASAEAAAQSAASVDVHADGNYPEMTVGTSEQLLSTQYVTEKTPYLYRTTGGSSDVGNREYVRGIVGGTVAWNQLIVGVNRTNRGVTSVYDSNTHTCTFSGTTTTSFAETFGAVSMIANHKYLTRSTIVANPNNVSFSSGILSNVSSSVISGNEAMCVARNTQEVSTGIFGFTEGTDVTGIKVMFICFDLTQMFGTTIADYIYSLEQANAGAGVAWVRKLFPNDYYPYDSGTLKSVEGVSSHEMVGFNQWDEEWELGSISTTTGQNAFSDTKIRSKNYIPVFPSTQYCISGTASVADTDYLYFYDENKAFINSVDHSHSTNVVKVFETPSNARYMRFIFRNLNPHDICINLSWSDTHNGEYKPYEKHSYALDDSLTLRGIPKLDNGSLYYDGDVYAPDGTVTRRYGIVDLGTLTWVVRTASGNTFFQSDGLRGIIKPPTDNTTVANCIVPNFTVEYWYGTVIGDRIIAVAGANDSYSGRISCQYTNATTVEEFKAAMSGVYLVYELATPTTENAEPYAEIQICDDWGTEEYVSTSIVPVGHTTDYPANLRDKLQHLPDLASADGNYIVSQSGTQMTLAPLPIVIPAPPTTDGNYTFRATVSNGEPTLSWVEE